MTITRPALASILLFTMVASSPALATEDIIVEPPQQVERWFAALGSVSRRDFKELIADDAIIALRDLGVEQTKDEFIAALPQWARATRKANIIYRYETIEDGEASALVCYRFKSNEQLNVESFTFNAEQITGSVQEAKGDNCGDM